MSESLDPYHRWLGIPPKDQPPNYYRLLSLELFESDPNVIEIAADRQMGHLRTYQTGRHAALSQKLLNEVATAKVCLLNPQKKEAYDGLLKEQLAQTEPSRSAPPPIPGFASTSRAGDFLASPSPVAEFDPSAADAIEEAAQKSLYRKPKKAFPPIAGFILVCMLGIAAVVGVLLWKNGALKDGGFSAGPPANQLPKPHGKVESVESVESKGSLPVEPSEKPKVESGEAPTEHVIQPSEPKPVASEDTPKGIDSAPLPGVPMPETPPQESPDGPTIVEQARIAVPSVEEQSQARQVMEEFYRDKFTAAKQPTESANLAQELIGDALAAIDDRPGQYVRLVEATNRAQQAREFDLAFQAIEQRARLFEEDPVRLKGALLQQLTAADDAERQVLLEKWLAVAEEAFAKDEFRMSAAAAKAAQALATTLDDQESLDEIGKLLKRVSLTEAEYARVSPAMKLLESNPDDPIASGAVGRYRCFRKGNWEDGLTLLAKADNMNLRRLAERDLFGPQDASEQGQLGDGWWDEAQNWPEPIKAAMLERASYWYERALPELSGQRADAIRARLAGSDGSPTTGAKTAKKPPARAVRTMELRITAVIDGSDELQLHRTHVAWSHLKHRWPAGVLYNGKPWNPQKAPKVPFDRASLSRFRNIDFSSAELQKIRGRGTVELRPSDDQLTIIFDDSRTGGIDTYQIVVRLKY